MTKYGLHVGGYPGHSIRSDAIAARLDPANPDHARHLAAIARLERDGMRYANEDCDVLGAAWRAGS